MTVEENLLQALALLVSDRCFPDFAPGGTAPPFIVFQQAGGQAPTFLERAVPSKKNARMQVNVWAATRAESAAIAIQVEAALVASTQFDAKPLSAPISLVDEDNSLRGSSQDFSVWSDR